MKCHYFNLILAVHEVSSPPEVFIRDGAAKHLAARPLLNNDLPFAHGTNVERTAA
jgi:hypothetical protein